jgi:ABC-type multidrug transport system permease subunit
VLQVGDFAACGASVVAVVIASFCMTVLWLMQLFIMILLLAYVVLYCYVVDTIIDVCLLC